MGIGDDLKDLDIAFIKSFNQNNSINPGSDNL